MKRRTLGIESAGLRYDNKCHRQHDYDCGYQRDYQNDDERDYY